MRGMVLALALASIALGAVAQVLLKLGMTAASMRAAIDAGAPWGILRAVLLSPGVIGGLALYGLGTVLWLAVLTRAELSQAYPFVGLSFVLTAAMGYFLFADAMTLPRIAGIALIVAGVVLVGRN
ncbi:MAG: small multi-drug resistant family protein [Acetobacteraceae bacterium]|nr:small multi-drug resistant family protein [Acetobacteraceae bacterium]